MVKDGGSHNPISVAVIITAAGASTRMQGQKKEYLPLGNKPGTVLSAATESFLTALESQATVLPLQLDTLIITIPAGSGTEEISRAQEALQASPILQALMAAPSPKAPALQFVEGGKSRQASVHKALEALAALESSPQLVLIHDGARPFVCQRIIQDVVVATLYHGAAACGIPPVDTQKEIDGDGFILRHLDRGRLTAIQTPQGFIFEDLLEAHRLASQDEFDTTDDTAVWGRYKGKVKVVQGSTGNKKITFPEDLDAPQATEIKAPVTLRTGLGYDLHRLEDGRQLILGGVAIPFHKGESGHSDGDALLHAVTDALLGAVARSDIGELFPPTDSRWKDADSKCLLADAWRLVKDAGWRLANLDCVIAIEQPKILPHREAICDNIAAILEVDSQQVFVKAKTGERLGAVGRGEAVEVWATCLLTRK